MLQSEYTENLFRSIDTIIAERIKNLPYDTTQLAEIIDTTNCQQGMYKVTADKQYEEIVYSDNPTYEVGDKVYVLTTADKNRRFIIGIFQKNSSGRTDRVLSNLNQKIQLLDDSINGKYLELKDETGRFMSQLSITAKELRSEYFDLNQGLSTLISQTAEEILLKAENMTDEKIASLSITADGIYSSVKDMKNELETKINQTAREIRLEAEDAQNGLESNLSIAAEAIRSEVSNSLLEVQSSITQTANEIRSEVSDSMNGVKSNMTQMANEIYSQIQSASGEQESLFDQTLDEIKLQVSDIRLGVSEISQQTDKITSKVNDIEGNFSQIQQKADSITSRVEDVEGNYSEIKQTAHSIRSRVEDVNGYASTIEQKADNISSTVTTLDGRVSNVEQKADSIKLEVTDPTENGHGSKIQLTGNGITTTAKEIKFKGAVTFSDLKTKGSTTINGSNITTGTIDAERINAEEFNINISSSSWKDAKGSLGYGEGQDGDGNTTYGIKLSGPGGKNYLIATDAGIRMTHQNDDKPGFTGLYLSDQWVHITDSGLTANGAFEIQTPEWTGEYSNGYKVYRTTASIRGTLLLNGLSVSSSDRNVKNTINYDFSLYEDFFNQLQPVSYIYNNDNKNKIHIGFIYQDVEKALLRNGLKSSDFAGVYKTHNNDGSMWCGLAYTEFVALNTYMIQKTRKEKEELEQRTIELENKVAQLESLVQQLLEKNNN